VSVIVLFPMVVPKEASSGERSPAADITVTFWVSPAIARAKS
jgi:hypothetical protein